MTHRIRITFAILCVSLLTGATITAVSSPGSSQSALQTAITNSQLAQLRNLDGEISVTSTITTPYKIGGVMQGQGCGEAIADAHALRGGMTRLVWGGGRTGATTTINYYNGSVQTNGATRPTNTLLYYRSVQWAMRDLSLWGGTRAQIDAAAGQCPLAILISQDQGGIGTGKLSLENIYFQYFATCIQSATTWDEYNCDQCAVDTAYVKNCDTFLKLMSQQSLGWDLDGIHLELSSGGTALDVYGGGDIKWDGGSVLLPCTLLALNAHATQNPYGTNVSKATIRDIKYDSQSVNGLAWVTCEAGENYYYNVDIIGHHLPATTPTLPLCDVGGIVRVHIDGAKNLPANAFEWQDSTCVYIVTNSTVASDVSVAGDLFNEAASPTGADCQVIVSGCFVEGTNARIADIDTTLTGTQ